MTEKNQKVHIPIKSYSNYIWALTKIWDNFEQKLSSSLINSVAKIFVEGAVAERDFNSPLLAFFSVAPLSAVFLSRRVLKVQHTPLNWGIKVHFILIVD